MQVRISKSAQKALKSMDGNTKRRIREFYKDGFSIIPQVANALGFMVGIDIPRRYRRHFDMMGDE